MQEQQGDRVRICLPGAYEHMQELQIEYCLDSLRSILLLSVQLDVF